MPSTRTARGSRPWLVAGLFGAIAIGVTIVLLQTNRLDGLLHPIPRADSFEATVLLITADLDAIGVERDDGSHEGFQLVDGALGSWRPRRGDRVALDAVYLNEGTFALSVRPAA
jgi:hypothetical protein